MRRKTERRAVEVANLIRDTIEKTVLGSLLPRAIIDVHVMVMTNDGGARSCAINAAVMAIVDAGIPCADLTASIGADYLDGQTLLDLNYMEDGGNGPDVLVAMQTREVRKNERTRTKRKEPTKNMRRDVRTYDLTYITPSSSLRLWCRIT